MKANEIVGKLQEFQNSNYQKILINGGWGIGKTKYVNDFIEDYDNACYISLFGKRTIDSVIQEIYYKIIERAKLGKTKKIISNFMKHINSLDVSYLGFSLSIPLIENMIEKINKEITDKKSFIVVFDDLERKHDELSLKEIFGLIDSLSKKKNIKTVLIASKSQLIEEDQSIFSNYEEKAIDRKYTVDNYADNAPAEILGSEIWKTLEGIAFEFKFSNLRTFEKTSLFISEVIYALGENSFNQKFAKKDIYKICFSIVIFKTEHSGEMRLLDFKNEDETMKSIMMANYCSDISGNTNYIFDYILKKSLNNLQIRSIISHILNWYDTGNCSQEAYTIIEQIKKYKKPISNFYSSEEEIMSLIESSKDYLNSLSGQESIHEILLQITEALDWCDILSIEYGLDNNAILDLIKMNIIFNTDIEKQYFNFDSYPYPINGENSEELLKIINDEMKKEYYRQYSQKILNLFHNKKYVNRRILHDFKDSLYSVREEYEIKTEVLEFFKKNSYLFPIPKGKISEEQWGWCHSINNILRDIEGICNNDLYSEFKNYVYDQTKETKDKLLVHRLKLLFDKKN